MRLRPEPFAALAAVLLIAAACPDTASGKPRSARPSPVLPADLETPSYASPYQRDAAGWTLLAPVTLGPKTTRAIYVSSSQGADTHDGLSPTTPMKTLNAASKKLRTGYPDHLLLRRGDVFEESLWLKGLEGLARDKPIVITAFGPAGPRPLLKTGNGSGIGLHPAHVSRNIAIVGLAFEAHFRNPNDPAFRSSQQGFNDNAGIDATTQGGGILIEDCEIRYFASGMIVKHINHQLLEGVEIRRNSVHHIWSEKMSQGLYTYNIDGLLIEENFFDQIGYLTSEKVPGTMFNHAMYLQNQRVGLSNKPASHTVVRGNFIARSDGIQMRDGGLAEDNFFWRTWIALMCGGGNDSTLGGALCVLQDNVVLDGGNISKTMLRGWGFWMLNLRKPSRATRNIIANNTHGGDPRPFYLDASRKDDHGRVQRIQYLKLQDNIVYRFGRGLLVTGNAKELQRLELVANVVELEGGKPVLIHAAADQLRKIGGQGNRFDSGGPEGAVIELFGKKIDVEAWNDKLGQEVATAGKTTFVDPARSLSGYSKMLGFADEDALLKQAALGGRGRNMEKLRGAVLAGWVREGFQPATTP